MPYLYALNNIFLTATGLGPVSVSMLSCDIQKLHIKKNYVQSDNDSDIHLCCRFVAFVVRNFVSSCIKITFSTMITNFDKLCGDLEKQELEVKYVCG